MLSKYIIKALNLDKPRFPYSVFYIEPLPTQRIDRTHHTVSVILNSKNDCLLNKNHHDKNVRDICRYILKNW